MAEITIKDVARECGVGISTVSRAINNHSDINPETRKMILDAIERTGYVPNNSARNLKRTEAKTIAILIKGITNPLFADMIKVFEEETHRRKYGLELKNVETNEDEVKVALELIKEKKLKGIIFLGGYFYHSAEIIGQLTVPYIFSTVGSSVPENINPAKYSSVAVDDFKESYRMTRYLLDLGHTDIAFITGKDDVNSIGQLRLEGYRQALEDRGIAFREELIRYIKADRDIYSMENGYLTTKELLGSDVEFSAVYTVADILAIGASKALLEAGKRIPEDISVVGFDGIELGKYYSPSITTIRQPVKEMAEKTISLLFDIMSGYKECEHVILPAELVERQSSGRCKL